MNSKFYSMLAAGLMTLVAHQAAGQAVVIGEKFEGEAFPPSGWVMIDNDGDGKCWQAQSGNNYASQISGSKIMAISYTANPQNPTSYYSPQDNWLVTPPIEIKHDRFVVSLSYAAQDLEHTEPIELLVSENGGTNVADFVQIWKTTMDQGYNDDIEWESVTRALSAYVGKTIRLAVCHQAKYTYGLSIDNFYVYDQTGPKSPTVFTATADATGDTKVTLKWTNPTATGTGATIDDFSVVVYRDGSKLTELNDLPAGEVSEFVDSSVTTGTHTYYLTAKNDAGESVPTATRSVYVGEDVTKPVGDPSSVLNPDGSVTVTWTAPTKGANSGMFDATKMTYNVYRGGNLLQSGVKECSFVDAAPVEGTNVYHVTSVTGGGESAYDYLTSVIVTTGDNIDLMIGQTVVRNNSLARLPVELNSKYSVSQTIYYADELNHMTGEIKNIVYKAFRGASNELTSPFVIYISETELNELTDWAPVTEAHKVFEGEITFESGCNDVMVTLDTPFNYTGGNLLVTFVKSTSPNGGYSDRFFSAVTEQYPNRSFTTSVYDPINISALPHNTYSDKKVNEVPSTRFIISPKGIGSLSGKVTSGNSPVTDATVSADGFDGICAVTDSEGNYTFKFIPVATASVTASKVGYEPATVNVSLTEGQTATANIELIRNANFTLSGSVKTEDTGLSAVNATVTLSGFEEQTTKVNVDGTFAFDGVYSGKDYTLTVTYPLYDTYSVPFNREGSAAVTLEPIVLDRALIPVWDVTAAINETGSAAILSWKDPAERTCKAGVKSIGDVSEQRYTGGDYYSSVYNVAHVFSEAELNAQNMIGSVVKSERVYLKADKGTFYAKVWRGTREDHIEVASQPIPLEMISADGAWITVDFDNPAEIKSGSTYMVGIEVSGDMPSYPIGESAASVNYGGNNVRWGDNPWSSDAYSSWCIQAICATPGSDVDIVPNPDAPKCAYNVYRGIKGENDSMTWTQITNSPINVTNFSDETWSKQLPGEYTYAITAVYNKVGESQKAFSEVVSRAVDTDVALLSFISPVKSVEMQTNVSVEVRFANFGELPVESVPVKLTLNGNESVSATYTGSLNKGEEATLVLGDITLAEGLNVLVATIDLEADGVAANNSITFELPNFENIELRGYRWDAYGNAGFMDFQSNNPEAAVFRQEMTPNDALIIAGEAVNGTFYGFTATWWGASCEFVEIDPLTWTLTRAIENTDDYVMDMAYDYAGETMYCLTPNESYEVTLGKVNLSTGTVERIGALGMTCRALACDLEGNLYAISDKGEFCSVDPETGEATIIGNTGAGSAVYLQSMAFDHNTERLFWAQTNDALNGSLHEINPATGTATPLGVVMFAGYDPSEIVGLYSNYIAPAKSFAAIETTPADGDGIEKFEGVTIRFANDVVADRQVMSTISFTSHEGKWDVTGESTAEVRVFPTDLSGNAVTIDFEPETDYTLTIPEGTFLKANGDYSEQITLVFKSTAAGLTTVTVETGKRYFNLQGIEIKSPKSGSIYIIRNSDGTTTKEVIK